MSVAPGHLFEKSGAAGAVGTYRRRMPVSLERLLENALDWEHLRWLHSSSFRSIELESHDQRHWCARTRMIGIQDPSRLELRLHDDRMSWTTRTLEGTGAGTHIDTRVVLHGERDLEVVVKFFVPASASNREKIRIGKYYVDLYRRLYEEDKRVCHWS